MLVPTTHNNTAHKYDAQMLCTDDVKGPIVQTRFELLAMFGEYKLNPVCSTVTFIRCRVSCSTKKTQENIKHTG